MQRGLNTPHTLSAARYESGLDNSPQYDGNLDGNEGYGEGPLTFNGTTHSTVGNGMMELCKHTCIAPCKSIIL